MCLCSRGVGGSGRRMEAVGGASVFALLNRYEALVARAPTSVSTVADAGVGGSLVMNRGGCGTQCSTFGCDTEKGGGLTRRSAPLVCKACVLHWCQKPGTCPGGTGCIGRRY
jgi:hypothetical protein